MSRITYKKQIEERKNRNSNDNNNGFVDLKVSKEKPHIERKLRLVGHTESYWEYNKKKGATPTSDKIPFPDDHLYEKTRYTRIGLEDADQCPWAKLGYPRSQRYAVRCFEEQEDGTWIPKILNKGAKIFDVFFDWSASRRQEDEDLSYFLGGKEAPCVRIIADWNPKNKMGNVDYTINVLSKDTKITDDMIERLRELYEPAPEELAALRKDYKAEQKEDPDLADWCDWFEYGFNLRNIFKFTPPLTAATKEEDLSFNSEDEQKETPAKTPAKATTSTKTGKTATPAKTEELDDDLSMNAAFEEDSEDDEELDENVKW